ncbi:MAG TPA: hypothetical protein VM694_43655 [Polyangium sp.]|nr:hypothetical protein [Polyangium sp.]
MKTKTRVRFDANDVPGGEQTVLSPSRCGPDVAEVQEWPIRRPVVEVRLEANDPRLSLLLQLLLVHKVEWSEDRWDEYTDEEYESAPLIEIPGTFEVEVLGGPRFGTDYDLSTACPTCGAG